MKRSGIVLLSLAALLLGAGALVWQHNFNDGVDVSAVPPAPPAAEAAALVARGAYLARAGNCAACHTGRGGAPYAGGRGIETPFGTVYGSNLTPDPATGIGRWNAAEFWRALHHGRSKDGRLLSPAFPYTSTTQITRTDADALFAYLMQLPPVVQPNRPHALRWPYGTQVAQAVWRSLYFRPVAHAEAPADPARSAEWNRGAYLVRGLGHCAGCHSARNALGATGGDNDLTGGLIPMQNWYAPALTRAGEAGVADWELPHIVSLLKTGQSPRGQVTGPMAEVVQHSTQHLTDADLGAMASYLKSLPQTGDAAKSPPVAASTVKLGRGTKLYENHCAQCHGDRGEGVAGAYPALAGNRAVTMAQTTNLVQTVLHGGFAPATAGNPRPFGMPPYVLVLNDADVAAVLTHLRASWGNAAAEVTELDVNRVRASTGDGR
jgi:mono/diheme cytochrome c family protein